MDEIEQDLTKYEMELKQKMEMEIDLENEVETEEKRLKREAEERERIEQLKLERERLINNKITFDNALINLQNEFEKVLIRTKSEIEEVLSELKKYQKYEVRLMELENQLERELDKSKVQEKIVEINNRITKLFQEQKEFEHKLNEVWWRIKNYERRIRNIDIEVENYENGLNAEEQFIQKLKRFTKKDLTTEAQKNKQKSIQERSKSEIESAGSVMQKLGINRDTMILKDVPEEAVEPLTNRLETLTEER